MKHPALCIVIPLIFGIITGYLLSLYATVSGIGYIISMLIVLAVMAYFHYNRAAFAFTLATIIFCFLTGIMRFYIRSESVVNAVPEGTKHITGTVERPPRMTSRTIAVELTTDNGGRVLSYLQPKTILPKTGDRVELISTRWTKHTDNLLLKGISATCYSDSASWRILPKGRSESPLVLLKQAQTFMCNKYRQAGLTGNEGAIIEAMTTGNRQNITPELRLQYARSGASHILALSGFHLTFLYGVIEMFLLTSLVSRRWKAVMRCIALLFIWMFVVMTGMSPSLLRAAIMCSLMMLPNIVNLSVVYEDRKMKVRLDYGTDDVGRHRLIDSLAMAALVMLIYDPFMLFDISFQLSFISMTGIAACSSHIIRITSVATRIPLFKPKVLAYLTISARYILKRVAEIVLVSLVCTIITMPIVAYYFGIVPTLSLLTNIVLIPLATAILFFSLIWWILCILPSLQDITSNILLSLSSAMNDTTQWASSINYSAVEWHPSIATTCMSYALIGCIYCVFHIYITSISKPSSYQNILR